MIMDMLLYRSYNPDLLTKVMAYHLIDTTGATDGAHTDYPFFYEQLLVTSWYLHFASQGR